MPAPAAAAVVALDAARFEDASESDEGEQAGPQLRGETATAAAPPPGADGADDGAGSAPEEDVSEDEEDLLAAALQWDFREGAPAPPPARRLRASSRAPRTRGRRTQTSTRAPAA